MASATNTIPVGGRRSGAAKAISALARQSLAGLRVLIAFTLVLGLAYPFLVMAVGQVAFPWQANGSLVRADGSHATSTDGGSSSNPVVGSALIGQSFGAPDTDPQWFHSRPSAAGDGYDPLSSGGSNFGPDSPELVKEIDDRRAQVAAADGVDPSDVPPDAVTASASGLDPDISPQYADEQVARVAKARGMDEATVRSLVAKHTSGRDLGVLGEPRVNVFELNLDLAQADD